MRHAPFGPHRLLLLFAAFSLPAALPARGENPDLNPLVELLGEVEEADFQLDLLRGMRQGLVGRRNVPPPEAWERVYPRLARSPEGEVRILAREIALVLGDPRAVEELRALAADPRGEAEPRRAALALLGEHRAPQLGRLAAALLEEPEMRIPALRALAACEHPNTPELLLAGYSRWNTPERHEALATLAGRVTYARQLLAAMEAGRIPPAEVPAHTARQLASLGDEELAAAVARVWGELRPSSEEKQAAMRRLREELTPERLAAANPTQGRLLFRNTCGKCHKLFEEGGEVGPDLTGSQRRNLEYLIENVVDPNAQVARGYQVTRIITLDGRVLSGVLVEETPSRVTLATVEQRIVVPRGEVEELALLPTSLMPEGQFAALTPEERLHLTAYLMSDAQVRLP